MSGGMEKGPDPSFDNAKTRDVCAFNKSEDLDRGIVFGRVKEVVDNDFLIQPMNSDKSIKLPKQ